MESGVVARSKRGKSKKSRGWRWEESTRAKKRKGARDGEHDDTGKEASVTKLQLFNWNIFRKRNAFSSRDSSFEYALNERENDVFVCAQASEKYGLRETERACLQKRQTFRLPNATFLPLRGFCSMNLVVLFVFHLYYFILMFSAASVPLSIWAGCIFRIGMQR